MRHTKILLSLMATVLLALPAAAAHYADFYVIPVAGHVPGAFDTLFRSDVMIQNFQETPITVEMAFVESGTGISGNVYPLGEPMTIPANGSMLLEDALEDYRGMSSVIGSILIGADKPFAVTSRAYTMDENGSYGQTVPAVADFIDDLAGDTNNATATAYIPGARSDGEFRTNIGMVAGSNGMSGMPLTVEVRLFDQSGDNLGSTEVVVMAGAINHTQFNTSTITNATFEIAGVEMRIVSGDGEVVPYISVVDNESGDGMFVLGTFPNNSAMAAKTSTVSVFREMFDRVRTDR